MMHPPGDLFEKIGFRLREPSKIGGKVTGMEMATGSVMNCDLIEFSLKTGNFAIGSRVGVGCKRVIAWFVLFIPRILPTKVQEATPSIFVLKEAGCSMKESI